MKIVIIDIDKFIKINDIEEVTNSMMLHNNVPTPDGILSYQIFGFPGSIERKEKFGYLDLKNFYFHPFIYKILQKMYRKIDLVIQGELYLGFEKNKLVEIKEKELDETKNNIKNIGTGIPWLYKNWDDFLDSFLSDPNTKREKKLVLMKKNPKNTIFISKWILIPAFYRDLRTVKGKTNIITETDFTNKFYNKLLRKAELNKMKTEYSFTSYYSDFSIQKILVEIYVWLTEKIKGKTGMYQKGILGKNIDYSARSVISITDIKGDKPSDIKVPIGYVGIPLAQVLASFYPFVLYYVAKYFESKFKYIKTLVGNDGVIHKITSDVAKLWSPYSIKKMVNSFIHSPLSRFNRIYVSTEKGPIHIKWYYDDLKRDFTLTDLFFIICSRIIKDKHVYITRYPIDSYTNINPCKIVLLTTYKTCVMTIENETFYNYPEIFLNYPSIGPHHNNGFIDTVWLNASYLDSMGADFDGDTVSVRGMFTREANNECETLINNKLQLIRPDGSPLKKIINEAYLSAYMLTKE